MLICKKKHPELLGAVRLPSTLAAASVAVVAEFVPTLSVLDQDEGSIHAALEMDLDAAIPFSSASGPAMPGNCEKQPSQVCDRQGLFALHCRRDNRWDDIARRYSPCLPCPDLRSGKHAARLNSWMNPASIQRTRSRITGKGLICFPSASTTPTTGVCCPRDTGRVVEGRGDVQAALRDIQGARWCHSG